MGSGQSTPSDKPGVLASAYQGVKDTVATATQKAKDTLGVAGTPNTLTSTPSATNTLGTGAGDTMLGGRRRRKSMKKRGGRKSKKTRKH